MHVLDAQVRQTSPTELEGTIQTDVPEVHYNGDERYNLHFVTQFSRPFDRLGGWEADQIQSNVPALKLKGDCGAFVEFKTRPARRSWCAPGSRSSAWPTRA